jgi:hypothetical protein
MEEEADGNGGELVGGPSLAFAAAVDWLLANFRALDGRWGPSATSGQQPAEWPPPPLDFRLRGIGTIFC